MNKKKQSSEDYIKELEKQIDTLQKQYGDNEVRVKHYENFMKILLSRAKIRHSHDSKPSVLTVDISIAFDADQAINDRADLAEFAALAREECEQQEASDLALSLFIESGASGVELPDG